MGKRRAGLILGALALTVGLAVTVVALTHGPAGTPGTSDEAPAPETSTTTTAPPAPVFDPAQLRALLPSTDDLAGRYSGDKFRSISKSGVRVVPAGSPAFAGASAAVLGGVEQVFDAYNPYYQSDTTIVVRAVLFRTRAEAADFVARHDAPARVDNVTTRDSVPVSTFEYSQAGRYPSVAESMAATGYVVVWVKIVDSDALSIYTGVAWLMVEDAVVEAIDSFPAVAAPVG